MEERIIKTVTWSEAKELLTTLAVEKLGRLHKKPANFCEFIVSYPTVSRKRMTDFLNTVVLDEKLEDVTSIATTAEDSCLFSAETATAIEIMLRHLNTLNTGGKLKSLWGFLDDDKKAVIHFVNKGGWYAEAYFSSPEDFSVVHLMTSSRGEKFFIPVTFVTDLSKLATKVSLHGGVCLHDYLPRIKGDFLSRGGKRHKNAASNERHKRRFRDAGDTL